MEQATEAKLEARDDICYINSSREGEKQTRARHLVPRVFFHKGSREDSGYGNGIIGESRACRGGGKWITFRKKHREKRLGDEVEPFINIFDRKAVSSFVYLLLTNGTPFPTYNHGQKSWDTLAFLGRFPIHTGPTPPLTPKQSWTRVSRIFSEFQLCVGLGMEGGRTARKFSKRISSVL